MQTYDEILSRMTKKYTDYSGIIPDERSDIGIRLRVLAGEIYSNLVNMEWLKRQMFFMSAQGESLDMHAQTKGLERRKATKSTGEVTFSLNEVALADINIPSGVVVACAGDSLIRFVTTESGVITAGGTAVTLKAESAGEGSEYNVLPEKIKVMVTPPAGVDKVINIKNFTGGCDTESDESLRERIAQLVKTPANGTNCSYYEAIAQSVDGVSSAQAVPMGRGAGTVDVYIAADGVESNDETVSRVQALLSDLREINVDVLVKKAVAAPVNFYLWLKVKDGYSFEDVKDTCIRVIASYVNTRGVGGEVLRCHIGECMTHVDGVEEYQFVPQLNTDHRQVAGEFPVIGNVSITEGDF